MSEGKSPAGMAYLEERENLEREIVGLAIERAHLDREMKLNRSAYKDAMDRLLGLNLSEPSRE